MTLLEDLYFGNIQPCDYKESAEVKRKQLALSTFTEKMKTELSEQKYIDDLDRLWVKQTELTALAERDAYLAGFKFGVRMMVEVLSET